MEKTGIKQVIHLVYFRQWHWDEKLCCKMKKTSPRNAYFPPQTINEVQTRNCLYLVRWIPPSEPVAYIHSSQRPFVIVSIVSRLLGNKGPSTMSSRPTVEAQVFKAILGFLSYQILLCGLTWIWRVCLTMKNTLHGKWKRNKSEKPSFLKWEHILPPIAESCNKNWKNWKLHEYMIQFWKKKKIVSCILDQKIEILATQNPQHSMKNNPL